MGEDTYDDDQRMRRLDPTSLGAGGLFFLDDPAVMTQLHLRRVEQARQTLGVLSVIEHGERVWSCVTSELRWRDNENNRSCIPPAPGKEATYYVDHRDIPSWSDYDYPHLIVRDVPERTAILVHRGNYVSDTAGCLLVGRKIADIDGDGVSDITHSTETLRKLVDLVPEEGTTLSIKWAGAANVRGLIEHDEGMTLSQRVKRAGVVS